MTTSSLPMHPQLPIHTPMVDCHVSANNQVALHRHSRRMNPPIPVLPENESPESTATMPHTTTRATAPGSGVDCICTQSPKCCEIPSTPDPLAVTTTMPHTAARATAPRSGTDCIHNQVNVADG